MWFGENNVILLSVRNISFWIYLLINKKIFSSFMSLTKKLQSNVEEYMGEIADELNISIPFYPQVYWVGRNFSFKKIGVNGRDLEECYEIKKNSQSAYLAKYKIILVSENNIVHISEEAGHCLHFSKTNLHERKNSYIEERALRIISEMFGYFCSKLIFPERINEFAIYPDHVFEKAEFEKFSLKNLLDKEEFLIYKQGYDLGDLLFNAYVSKEISKNEIRKLFLMDFKEPNSGLYTVINLKINLLNFEKKNIVN